MTRSLPWIVLGLVGILAVWLGFSRKGERSAIRSGNERIPIAVLGDSDSHAYHDSVFFPANTKKRGGAFRSVSWQWTEILQRLRSAEIDQGDWGLHGTRGVVARANRWLGREGRSPPKQDFHYNFAVSGAQCEDLLQGYSQQTKSLLSVMDQDPPRWRNGVVVIRIGINDLGEQSDLDALAQDPKSPVMQEKISGCIGAIRQSVALIRRHHPQARIVLVGIFDNSNWPRYHTKWQDPAMLRNIDKGLDVFDSALADMAANDSRIAFFDDRAWFASHWGSRDARGRPAYRVLKLDGLRIGNTAGDARNNAVLADGHAGTAWNVEWVQALVTLMNSRFQFGITPISDAEAVELVKEGTIDRNPRLGANETATIQASFQQ